MGAVCSRGAALPAGEAAVFKWLAYATHFGLYALLILMPVSGAVAWFAGLGTPALAHSLMEKLLIVLIGLHILGALAQHFVFRTDVLKRMLGMA